MSARQRSGRGEPLVLLHGVGLDHTLWDDLAPLLAPDFEVLRYDLLGHGAAPALRGPAAIGDFIAQLSYIFPMFLSFNSNALLLVIMLLYFG